MKSDSVGTISGAGARANRLAGLFEPATVVLFAGLGGVCIGVEQAYVDGGYKDKYIDLAVNHWDTAVGVHELNHPMTHHLRADVWEVDPDSVILGRRIAYLHLSPDCVDFSRAKGSAPKRKHIRALADVGLVWAGKRRPSVITLENVCEFRQWGPLLPNGQPDPDRRGEEFDRWCNALRAMGYELECRDRRACDDGVPTTRKRLALIARCDGKPIIWPEATHASAKSIADAKRRIRLERVGLERNELQKLKDIASRQPYRTAAECIDWSIPMLSIFATPDEAKAFAKKYGCGVPRRPLKPKTLARIAGGLDKFVIKAAKPFIVDIQNYGWNTSQTRDVDKPSPTITSGPKGGGFAVVDATLEEVDPQPFVVRTAHGDDSKGGKRWGKSSHPTNEPLGANTGSPDDAAVDITLAPFTAGVGGRAGQSPETSVENPLPTVTGKADRVVVAATLTRDFGQSIGSDANAPAPTATGMNHTGIVAATLSTLNHGGEEHRGADLREPVATVTGANDARALVAALVTKHYGGVRGSGADAPLDTVTGCDHNALTTAHLVKFRGDSLGTAVDEPVPTITGGGETARDAGAAHALGVSAIYLSHLYGTNQGGNGDAGKPAPTITGSSNHTSVVSAALAPFLIGAGGSAYAGKPKATDEPANTVMVNDRRAMVAVFMAAFYGQGSGKVGHSIADPLPTITAQDRFGLVTVTIDGTTYVITDIAMRMLTPRELAKAQGFSADYVIDRTSDGKRVSKADQVKLIGNSVPPGWIKAIAKANVVDLGVMEDAREAVPA